MNHHHHHYWNTPSTEYRPAPGLPTITSPVLPSSDNIYYTIEFYPYEQRLTILLTNLLLLTAFIYMNGINKIIILIKYGNSFIADTRPLVVGSVGPYGAHLHDGSEYDGSYADTTSVEVS